MLIHSRMEVSEETGGRRRRSRRAQRSKSWRRKISRNKYGTKPDNWAL